MSDVVCTLYEGKYELGVIALLNSLLKAEFEGRLYIGYRGKIGNRLQEIAHSLDQSDAKVDIIFKLVETEWHLTNFKPIFMLHALGENPCADRIYYLDPDIVVKCGWSFLQQWTDLGISLCEDVNSPMHPTHPKRLMWKEDLGFRHKNNVIANCYVNAGFIGLRVEQSSFLDTWINYIELVTERIGGAEKWYGTSPENTAEKLYASYDQDALNIALASEEVKISVANKDAMDFEFGGYILSHAIGPIKPWHFGKTLRALRGIRVSLATDRYVDNLNHPYPVFPNMKKTVFLIDYFCAKVIGKFIR